jgi:hypothetical protein
MGELALRCAEPFQPVLSSIAPVSEAREHYRGSLAGLTVVCVNVWGHDFAEQEQVRELACLSAE